LESFKFNADPLPEPAFHPPYTTETRTLESVVGHLVLSRVVCKRINSVWHVHIMLIVQRPRRRPARPRRWHNSRLRHDNVAVTPELVLHYTMSLQEKGEVKCGEERGVVVFEPLVFSDS